MDFMRHNNFGYGFVNFTTSEAASRIMSLLDGFKWRADQSFLQVKSSKKICQVTFARIQGKRELVKHFQQSRFCCTESEYLPVTFSPPRNGSTSLPNPSTVGTLNCNQVLQKRLPGA
ncbi:hypothetical protein Leryth_018963 [Lithospermum erythrorhizon]|nr:hypothetical protein Leryth_018963 [Lithospermum erythrorhizon]